MFHGSGVHFFASFIATEILFNLLQGATFGFGDEFEGEEQAQDS